MNYVIGLLLPPYFQTAPSFRLCLTSCARQAGFGGVRRIDDVRRLSRAGRLPLPCRPFIARRSGWHHRHGVSAEARRHYNDCKVFRDSRGRPMVSLILPKPGCSCVMTDDRAGAYAATIHLLDLGHRHIIHSLRHHRRTVSSARLEGACQAMCERGLDPEQHLHYFSDRYFGISIRRTIYRCRMNPRDEMQAKALSGLHELIKYLHAIRTAPPSSPITIRPQSYLVYPAATRDSRAGGHQFSRVRRYGWHPG